MVVIIIISGMVTLGGMWKMDHGGGNLKERGQVEECFAVM